MALRSVLAHPLVYRIFSGTIMRDKGFWPDIAAGIAPGSTILDLGCGPGRILDYLPDVRYTGVDISESYIEAARSRYGDRAEFAVGDATYVDFDDSNFDLVMAIGLLHHLPDEGVRRVIAAATRALKPGGRLITFDGCYVKGQHPLARALLNLDRGEFVRTESAYLNLVDGCFLKVEPRVRHDLLRVPYTHLILNCSGPIAP